MSGQALTGEGSCDVGAPPGLVWLTLLDPETLRTLIPGTDSVERLGDRYVASLSYGAGRIRARYRVELVLSGPVPPGPLALSGHSEGRLGWGRANAAVALEPAEAGRTTITWRYEGVIGGPVSLLGGLVLRSAARVFVGRFFSALARRLEANAGG